MKESGGVGGVRVGNLQRGEDERTSVHAEPGVGEPLTHVVDGPGLDFAPTVERNEHNELVRKRNSLKNSRSHTAGNTCRWEPAGERSELRTASEGPPVTVETS